MMTLKIEAREKTGRREVMGIPDTRLPEVLEAIGLEIISGKYSGSVEVGFGENIVVWWILQ